MTELRPYLELLPAMDFAASLALVLVLFVIRFVAGHAIRSRTTAAPHVQRRWIASVRNSLFLLGLFGLVLIWAPQLRTVAISLTAVAVAVVIATKELILCFSGALMRVSSSAFAVGDWIEVNGIHGEVIDHNMFATTLHEFAPGSFNFTGRTAVIPNSAFLVQAMRNDSLTRNHVYHHFALTLDRLVDIYSERTKVEELVARHYEPFREEALRANQMLERRFGVDLMDTLLRVDFRTSDIGKPRVEITLFCATHSTEALQNDITCAVMAYWHAVASREGLGDPAVDASEDARAAVAG